MRIIWRGILAVAFVGICFTLMPSLVLLAPVDDDAIVIAGFSEPIALDKSLVRVSLAPTAAAKAQGITLASHIRSLRPERRIYLVVRDLSAARQPNALYDIYLDLQPDLKPDNNDPRYVGTLNFYDAVRLGRSKTSSAKNSRFFSFDITSVVRNLYEQKMLSDQTSVTIYPSGLPEVGSNPMIGLIELIEQ